MRNLFAQYFEIVYWLLICWFYCLGLACPVSKGLLISTVTLPYCYKLFSWIPRRVCCVNRLLTVRVFFLLVTRSTRSRQATANNNMIICCQPTREISWAAVLLRSEELWFIVVENRWVCNNSNANRLYCSSNTQNWLQYSHDSVDVDTINAVLPHQFVAYICA